MSSTLLQRHLCFHSRLWTGQQAWVSTTSAINRGLRATRDDGGSAGGDRDRFRKGASSTASRSGFRDKPPFENRRKLGDHVEYDRKPSFDRSDRDGRKRDREDRPAGRDRPSRDAFVERPYSSSGFRDRQSRSSSSEFRDRPSSSNEFRDRDRSSFSNRRERRDDGGNDESPRSSYGRRFERQDSLAPRRFGEDRPSAGRSRFREDSDLRSRDTDSPQERRGGRNRPGQRERRERATSGSFASGRNGRHPDQDEVDEAGHANNFGLRPGEKRRDVKKHIKNACRQIRFIQEKETAGEDITDLVADVKFALKRINQTADLESDEGADAVVSSFRDSSKPGTFLAGDIPDGEKSVIYITEEGELGVHLAQNPKITKAPNKSKTDYMDEKAKVWSEPSKSARRERQSRSDKDEEEIPDAVPYTTAASEFLYGYNSVLAALRARRRQGYKLYIHPKIFEREMGGEGTESGEKPASELVKLAKDANIPFINEFRTALLNQMSGDRPHNGVVLEASKLPAPPVLGLMKPELRKGIIPIELGKQTADEESIHGAPRTIRALGSSWRHPFVLLLDGITDPGNLGNIIRTAHFYGVDAVAVATNTCANLSSAILAKASSGACEAVQILAVPSASGFIHSCSRYRWKIYGAVAPTEEERSRQNNDQYLTTSAVATNSPLAKHSIVLMLGAEGEGLRQNLRARADKFISIEGGPRAEGTPDVGVDSMNVSVATGILLEALMRKPVDAPDSVVAGDEELIGS